jgi:pilus assembly protein Flp/PilA
MNFLKQFIAEEQGQDMVEYGLVIALIALVAVVGVTTFGTNLKTGFNAIAGTVAADLP